MEFAYRERDKVFKVRGLIRFFMTIGYVAAVLFVTTIEAGAYLDRAKAGAREQYDEESVAAIRDMTFDDVAVKDDNDRYKAFVSYVNPVGSEARDINDTAGSGEKNNNEKTKGMGAGEAADDTVSGNDEVSIGEDPGNIEDIDVEGQNDSEASDNAGQESIGKKRKSSDFFKKWLSVCEQFMASFNTNYYAPHESYEKTLKINQADKKCIEESIYVFSEIKITCLGDSLTAASNLEDEENYEQYSYPSVLKELLGAKEVYNLGIGGSSIGRYWADPFVERYTEIPEDTDIIIVMGGYNDGFCVTKDMFGSLDNRAHNTFCGDMDELLKGIKERYPDTAVFVVTPMSNVLHGALMTQNENLVPQEEYVKVMGTLAEEYGFEFVDLYSTGFLDSYDEDVAREFFTDNTHGNAAGYKMLAEHIASEIIKYYDRCLSGKNNGYFMQNEINESNDSEAVDEGVEKNVGEAAYENFKEDLSSVMSEPVEDNADNVEGEAVDDNSGGTNGENAN